MPEPHLKFSCPACGKRYSLKSADFAAAGGAARPRCAQCGGRISVRQGETGLEVTLEEAPPEPQAAPGPEAAPVAPSAEEAPEDLLAGPAAGERLGRYVLEALIGRGGMGSVYRAFDPATNRQVALKVLPPGTPELDVARFEREIQVQGNVKHPQILQIFDSGRAGAQRYYTMELLREPLPLSQLCAMLRTGESARSVRLKPLSTLQGLVEKVMVPLCEAVHHANLKEGVLHRDLTPSNVLVDVQGLRPYLIDFGVCTLLERKNPRLADLPSEAALVARGATRTVSGTLVYMPPEQIQGKTDRRGDVWGLGALLHFLVTGEPPVEPAAHALVPRRNRIEGLAFLIEQAEREGNAREAKEFREKLENLKEGRERTLADVQQDVARGRYQPRGLARDPALDAVIGKAMAPDPELRYRNARELKQDLEAWLAGRAPTALAEAQGGAAHALYAWRQRLKRWRGPLVALVLLAVAGIWVASLLRDQAEEGDRRALEQARRVLAQLEERRSGGGADYEKALWNVLELAPRDDLARAKLRWLDATAAWHALRDWARTLAQASTKGNAAGNEEVGRSARAALLAVLEGPLAKGPPPRPGTPPRASDVPERKQEAELSWDAERLELLNVARDERRVTFANVAAGSTLTLHAIDAQGGLGAARAVEPGANLLTPGRYVLAVAHDGRRVHVPFELSRAVERLEVAPPLDPAKLPARTVYVPSGRALGPLGEAAVGPVVWEATEVTVERYAAWLDTLPAAEQARRVPREAGRLGAVGRPLWERREGRFEPPKADLKKPVDAISLHDARAFAMAEGRRLPTALEWAWAATGPFGALCALGSLDRAFSDRACLGPAARAPREVGASPGDVSLFGLSDLAGNVAELTSTLTTLGDETGWLVMGSGYGLAPERARAASAEVVPGWMPLSGVGFRLVMDAP